VLLVGSRVRHATLSRYFRRSRWMPTSNRSPRISSASSRSTRSSSRSASSSTRASPGRHHP
jgi:hypothetical protein